MFKALKFNLPWGKSKKKIKKILLGICAMDKKARSKPMREILERLPHEIFEVVYFGDDCILNSPVDQWPVVEVLIAFYSTKFPTDKAQAYVKLRKPFLINDLTMEEVLKDRRKVYNLLESIGIDVPFHVYVNRDSGEDEPVIDEYDEYIVINGVQINKPLVEKPVDAEDHNIYIYYPMHAGGGSKRLFRKVNDRSSEFYPTINEVRREGSYIYEEFVLTHGTDVKVYTVGCDYGHAEARKSPVVDGRVKRDSNGREVRFPVILSQQEKDMARKIVRAFRAQVCGFDILRVQGRSYCCDVNGFSFVKNSRKYYDDASQILTEMMVNAVRPEYKSPYSTQVPLLRTVPTVNPSPTTVLVPPSSSKSKRSGPSPCMLTESEGSGKFTNADIASTLPDDRSPSPDNDNSVYFNASQSRYEQEELRGVIAIIRHGDRTPKQKIKLVISEPRFLDYFHSYVKTPIKELKVKSKSGLLRFLEVTREVIGEKSLAPELRRKLYQIRDVLERWEISGINRKLQMKPLKWEDDNCCDEGSPEPRGHGGTLGSMGSICSMQGMVPSDSSSDLALPDLAASAKQSPSFTGIYGEQRDKDKDKERAVERKYGLATEILIILKWGGDLTPLGREQAEHLGAQFRTEHYPESDNGGVLRLHATYRHDLKIKASDEGRVIKTAAAFTKGLLALEGQLTPIISSLVTMEEKNRQMLDRGGNFEMKEEMDRCKAHLNLLQVDQEVDDNLIDQVAPQCAPAMRRAFIALGNPLAALKRMHYLIGRLTSQLEMICTQQYTFYEAQLEAQQLAAAQEEGIALSRANSSTFLDTNGASSGTAVKNRDRTASSGSTDMPFSNASSPRPPLQYIELGMDAASPLVAPSTSSVNLGDDEAASVDLQGFVPIELYLSETCDLMWDRWDKLHRDFYNTKVSAYDLTKVPDVFDMIRYDLIHNSSLALSGMKELFEIASRFERCVVPQEYGTDAEDKRYIGSKMCGALLEKIKHDLTIASANSSLTSDPMLYQLDQSHAEDLRINSFTRCVRTRLYFTSESHLHTVLNILRYAKTNSQHSLSKEALDTLEDITDVSYLSQIIIRLFQDRFDNSKYNAEIAFSSGTADDCDKSAIAPYVTIEKSIPLDKLMGLLDESIDLYQSSREERLLAEEEANDTSPIEAAQEQMAMEEEAALHTPDLVETEAVPAPVTHTSPLHGHPAHNLSPNHGPHHTHSAHNLHPHPYHGRRVGSITVNMDELNSLTSDRWENSTPHSNNTSTFRHGLGTRSYSLGVVPGGIRVPRPMAMRPAYMSMLEEEEGILLGGSGRSSNNTFRARRGYPNPNPQMKGYSETFMRKGSPSGGKADKAEALALHMPGSGSSTSPLGKGKGSMGSMSLEDRKDDGIAMPPPTPEAALTVRQVTVREVDTDSNTSNVIYNTTHTVTTPMTPADLIVSPSPTGLVVGDGPVPVPVQSIVASLPEAVAAKETEEVL